MPNNPVEGQESEDVQVQFTVKELLARIDGKIDLITGLVHEKADKADLVRLLERITLLERAAAEKLELKALEVRLGAVEKDTATKEAVADNKQSMARYETKLRWVIIATVVSMIGVATSILAVFLYVRPH